MSDIGSRILHCDATCVVVNKIPGEAAEGAGGGMVCLPTLLAAELDAPGDPPRAVHRLDVPVSGCSLFARNAAALRFLSDAFAMGAVRKRYWAIVEPPQGGLDPARFSGAVDLVHWIRFDPRRNRSTAHDEPGPGRKRAILRCGLVGRGRDYLFMEIDLVTGRHHQIRAQLERLGLRIKGDLKYGAKRSEKAGGIRLHARSLSFPDPAGGGRIAVRADPPLPDGLWQAFGEAAGAPANTPGDFCT